MIIFFLIKKGSDPKYKKVFQTVDYYTLMEDCDKIEEDKFNKTM